MSEEELEPNETPEEIPEPEAPEAAPVVDTAEIDARMAELRKMEADLRKGFDEVARREHALEQQPREPEEDPLARLGLDPEQARLLSEAIERRVASGTHPTQQAFEQYQVAVAQRELNAFAKTNDLDPKELEDAVLSNNLLTGLTPDALDKSFTLARDILKAKKFDPEAERQRLKEEVLKELRDEGVRIEDIKPLKPAGSESKADPWDEDLDPDERYRLLKARENK